MRELFERALEKINQGWVQGVLSVDSEGNPAGHANHAVAWCLEGALARAALDIYDGVLQLADAEIILTEHLGIKSIPAWNDHPERTQTDVVEALKAVIVECSA